MTPLSNEKVTYIEFQGDLCVTLAFGFSYSQRVPWNFSSLNLHKFEKYEDSSYSSFILIIVFTKLFYNIVQFILLYFGNICSRPSAELESIALEN